MPAPKTPTGKARHWVALKTSLLADTDLLLAGNAARLLFPTLILLSADQGLEGRVPADPRKVQLIAHLDGGVSECSAALDTLVDLSKLVADPDGDPAYLYIRAWSEHQADFGGSTTRSETARLSALKRAHNEGKHAEETRDGCELCAQGVTVEKPSAAPVALEEKPAGEWDGKRTMKAALSDFRDAIPATLAEFPTPFEGYTALLQGADEFADVVADLSDNARGALRNEVLAHAIRNLVDENISYPAINRANKAAKALGDDGHAWWIHAAVLAASVEFEDEKHAISWMTKTARGERAKKVSA